MSDENEMFKRDYNVDEPQPPQGPGFAPGDTEVDPRFDGARDGVDAQYGTRGAETGIGRSDAEILEDLEGLLREHPSINASDIQVQVTNGEVVLAGSADPYSIRLAQEVAEKLEGVFEVNNTIRLKE